MCDVAITIITVPLPHRNQAINKRETDYLLHRFFRQSIAIEDMLVSSSSSSACSWNYRPLAVSSSAVYDTNNPFLSDLVAVSSPMVYPGMRWVWWWWWW